MQNMEQMMRLSQELQLSPALLQSMKLLQMNTEQLADHINTISLENPTMEFNESGEEDQRYKEWAVKLSWFNGSPLKACDSFAHCDATSLVRADSAIESLDLFLRDQLSRLNLASSMEALCNYLVEMLDERGYLLEEDLETLEGSGIPSDMLSKAVTTLQSLEPAGLAARNLSECLKIQLDRLPGDHLLASTIVTNYFEDFAKGHYCYISQQLNVNVGEIDRVRPQIQALNVNPIQEFEFATPTVYISPDAWVAELDGSLQVMVNEWSMPRVRLCQDYVQLLGQNLDQDAEEYLRKKIQQTQWLMHCIERRHKTLESCLKALISWQEDFFLARSNSLRPLFQWQLAESISVHPSTLGRTIRNKYLQCKQGTFPLSYFFSKKVGNQADAPSEMEIKIKITQIITNENKRLPLSDEKLRKNLHAFGIDISRRTVAKYRSELGFSPSYLRKAK